MGGLCLLCAARFVLRARTCWSVVCVYFARIATCVCLYIYIYTLYTLYMYVYIQCNVLATCMSGCLCRNLWSHIPVRTESITYLHGHTRQSMSRTDLVACRWKSRVLATIATSWRHCSTMSTTAKTIKIIR